ncbi:hypothetical protein BC938DRAFT_481604 [Jimgerdemannia flammicorona]|uniref:Uncharacterized protein n=1 Tax=Jimgerdemannia flammicorona TaxID=994334 RepID=A0A433QWX6_9FUNG|nr:hypothetical protein BC938DRAFT_481604 [Jimgerdemannia flammicorona]
MTTTVPQHDVLSSASLWTIWRSPGTLPNITLTSEGTTPIQNSTALQTDQPSEDAKLSAAKSIGDALDCIGAKRFEDEPRTEMSTMPLSENTDTEGYDVILFSGTEEYFLSLHLSLLGTHEIKKSHESIKDVEGFSRLTPREEVEIDSAGDAIGVPTIICPFSLTALGISELTGCRIFYADNIDEYNFMVNNGPLEPMATTYLRFRFRALPCMPMTMSA